MDNHTCKVLEFDKVLRLLAKHITSEPGLESLGKLYPSTTIDEVREKQAETSEVKELLKLEPSFGLMAIRNLAQIFLKLSPDGAVLSPLEIWLIEELILEAIRLRNYFQARQKLFPKLLMKSDRIIALPELSAKIRQTISPQATVLDEASWRLNSIRHRLQAVRVQIKDHLDHMVKSHLMVVREPIITIRHNRYVLLLKPDFKKRFAGIIHDQSASGATLFVEPGEIIELNNRLIRLQLNEEEEIRRILGDITGQVKLNRDAIVRNLEIFSDFDLTLAKGKMSQEFNCLEPELSQTNSLQIRRGRHPLLLARIKDKDKGVGALVEDDHKPEVIPQDFEIGSSYRMLLITGPNAGGKTVALKAIGLLSLMFQAGMHIPAAEGSRLPVFHSIFADIGDEQSIEQNLSTFSAHMKNVSKITSEANENSLILLDELGAGTDPEEGAALGISILKHLHLKGALTVATTHHNALKHFVLRQSGMENASVEYDTVTLQPTFSLRIGQVGRSNALAVAAQAGLAGNIISGARDELGESSGKIEKLIGILQETTEREEKQFLALQEEKERVEKLKEKQEEILEDLKKEKGLLRMDFEKEKCLFFADARLRIKSIIDQVREKALQGQDIKVPEGTLRGYSKESLSSLEESESDLKTKAEEPIQLGDHVKVEALKLIGTVIENPGTEERVVVEVGTRRLRVPRQNLQIVSHPHLGNENKEISRTAHPVYLLETAKKSFSVAEINVIGQTVEEACTKVEKFLDDAVLQELPGIRIIHGRGTGRLRRGLWEMLKGHSLVKNIHFEDLRKGGTAVTCVEFEN